MQVWFYEHSSIYAFVDERRVPRHSSWINLYKGKKYDAGVVIRKLKDSEVGLMTCKYVMHRVYVWSQLMMNVMLGIISVIEVRDDERRIEAVEALIASEDYSAYVEDAQLGVVSSDLVRYLLQGVISVEEQLRRARDALGKEREVLAKEKEAHAATKKELTELKEAVAMKTTVDDILEFAMIQGLNSTADAPEMPAVGEERTNTDIFTPDAGVQVDPASSSSPVQSSDVAETITAGKSVSSGQLGHIRWRRIGEVGQVQRQSPYSEERPKSSITKRVRTRPRPRNPSVMQFFPYLHLDQAAGKGKRKCGNVYISQKRSKIHGGVSAAHIAGTDSDVGDESLLGSSDNANVESIMQPVADEGFPMGELRVDDVDGSVHVRMVAKEGVAEDAEGTAVNGDVEMGYVHNPIDQGGDGGRKSPCDVVVDAGVVVTDEKSNEGVAKDGPEVPTQSEKGAAYDGPMVAGVDAVHCDTHGTEAKTSAGPSTQTSAVVEGAVDEVSKTGRVSVVVTTSDEDSSPTSSEAGRGR
ncbi:hypothetical protein Cgig2_015833 [Carnegiea gigantea]|uniref:Uncharacterized protein n=1 Tax=Carnegiea gigantea TaxID=171969 RepID=A0A9Q1QIE4_9CARY|nr:hypothetical protein Cgig2_015833 [Carnegiea gigantea]